MSSLGVLGHRLLGRRTGVGRYLANLTDCWRQDRTPFSSIALYAPQPIADRPTEVVGPAVPPLLWEQAVIPARVRPDVLFCPSYTLPLAYRGPIALTVHDAIQVALPDEFPWRYRLRYAPIYARSARRADAIIAVSAATARDVGRYYRVAPERIHIVPLGVDPAFRPVEAAPTLRRLGLDDRPFVLFVGKISRRRNVPGLIEAFARADDGSRRLVLVGSNYLNLDLQAESETWNLGDRLRWIDWVDDSDLIALYSGAEIVVYPSKREGFGLPVLEAMACGAPVLTTNLSALRESATGAALLADGVEVADLIPPLRRLLDDADLRRRLSAAGPSRAARYRWETTARRTLDILAGVADG